MTPKVRSLNGWCGRGDSVVLLRTLDLRLHNAITVPLYPWR
jgi:hypothetical protein